VFTAQQLIVAAICLGIWITAPLLSGLYHLESNGIWFFRLTAISLFLTSLMVIPQVKMERHLAFDRLALIEVAQAISFNVVAVFLAWKGFGIIAFAAGLVARSTVGALLANLISPWAIKLHWDFSELKAHVTFGVFLQGVQLSTMMKDSITPLFVGMFLGPAQMGYATWALTFTGYPMLILIPMQRLYLPFFARLQNDKYALAHFFPRVLWIVNVIAAPLAVYSVALGRPITSIIFGDKWLIALPLFYCFFATNISAPGVSPMIGLLNAIGKPHLTLWIIGLSMVAIWAFGVPMILEFGLLGFGLASFVASFVNLLLYWFIWKETAVLPWRSYWPAWPLSLCIGVLVYVIQRVLPIHSIMVLAGYFLGGLVVYYGVLWLGFRQHCEPWIRLIRRTQAQDFS
jgi:O-antigen/teichoic acid export membrane protein